MEPDLSAVGAGHITPTADPQPVRQSNSNLSLPHPYVLCFALLSHSSSDLFPALSASMSPALSLFRIYASFERVDV
jgi:hypothetical protein